MVTMDGVEQFYRHIMPLRCEIDAYGDFMQVSADLTSAMLLLLL